jgi:hypothetical protein
MFEIIGFILAVWIGLCLTVSGFYVFWAMKVFGGSTSLLSLATSCAGIAMLVSSFMNAPFTISMSM